MDDDRVSDASPPRRSDRHKLTDATAVQLFRGRRARRWPRRLLLAVTLALAALAAWSALR